MTTNQTIDGVLVSRELLRRTRWELDAGTPSIATLAELRALLDAPAGIDWKAAHDTVLAHHRETFAEHVAEIERLKADQPRGEPVAILSGPDDSVCWTQDNTPKELRKQVVLIEYADFLRLQYLASGAVEPVYQTRWNRLGEWEEWKTVSCEQYQRSEGRLFERRIVYAEQPAPATCGRNQGRLP